MTQKKKRPIIDLLIFDIFSLSMSIIVITDGIVNNYGWLRTIGFTSIFMSTSFNLIKKLNK